MSLYFIEHMMIVSIFYLVILVSENSRILIYESNEYITTTLLLTIYTYTTYYGLSYTLIAEWALFFNSEHNPISTIKCLCNH